MPVVYHFSSSVLTSLYNIFMGLVISIYMIIDGQKLKNSIKRIIYALSPIEKAPAICKTISIMILILQQFDGLYLGPKILGDLTGIKPLWVIFGIVIGGAYFGAVGMFLGVPTVAVFMYLADLFIESKLKKKKIDLSDMK